MPVPFVISSTFDLFESEEDEWTALNRRLEQEGFSSSLADEKKLLYIWRWLVDAEHNLMTSRMMCDKLRAQQAQEMQEVEVFVETLKDITDQRVADVEEQKRNVEIELQKYKRSVSINETSEICEMLKQEGMTDILLSSVSEQVAYLLVERARLLEEISMERENHKGMAANLTDNLKLSSGQIQQLLEQQKSDFEDELRHLQLASQQAKERMKQEHEYELQELKKDLHQTRKRIQEMSSNDPKVRKDSLQGYCQEVEAKAAELAERIKIMEKAMRQLENENETLIYKLSEALAECDEKETLLKNKNNLRRTSVVLSPRAASTASDSPKRLVELLDNKITSAQQELSWVDQIRKLQGEIESLQQQLLKSGQELENMATKYQRRKAYGKSQIQKLKDQFNQERNTLKSLVKDLEREVSMLKTTLEKEKSYHERMKNDLKKVHDENKQFSNRLLEVEDANRENSRTITLTNLRVGLLEEEKAGLVKQVATLRRKTSIPDDTSRRSSMGVRPLTSTGSTELLDQLSTILTSVQRSLREQGVLPLQLSGSQQNLRFADAKNIVQKCASLTDIASLRSAEDAPAMLTASVSAPQRLSCSANVVDESDSAAVPLPSSPLEDKLDMLKDNISHLKVAASSSVVRHSNQQ